MLKKSVQDLLNRAEKFKENEKIALAITALLELGEDATHSNKEFKKLKALVETVEADGGEDSEETQDQEEDEGDTENTQETQSDADANTSEEKDEEKKEPKKLNMSGIRMIGAKWYHKSDKYRKGFATAKECALHYNH